MSKWSSVPSLTARLILLSLSLCAVVYAQTSAVPSGSGTSADPYQIDSLSNLYWLSQTSTAWADTFVQTSDIDASETSGWNSGSGWSPIGNYSTKFTGSFNGKGHVVTGLYIKRSTTAYVGLFGYTSGASIDSLGLEDVDISGYSNVGGLVGLNYASTVSNSYATGSVLGTSSYTGGLVGRNNSSSTVSNSYATGDVSGTSSVGGLVGQNNDSSTVSDCHVTGGVSGTSNNVGGLVGYNYTSTVSYSYATGNVSGASHAGGLVGYNYASSIVNNSYATGNVSGTTTVGGFVGYNNASSTVSNSYATGSVSGTTFVGGLMGYNYASTVSYSYATGSVSGTSYNVGGLVGYNYTSSTVSYCHFDTETSGQTDGIGVDSNGQTVTGLTTAQMKQSGNFTDWDSSTVWAFRADSAYPALRAVNNAPFAFADIVTGSVSALLTSDFDYETLKENLVYEIDSVYSITNSSAYSSLSEASNGDSLLVRYRVGEHREDNGGTLWGNQAWDCLKLDNTAPTITMDIDTNMVEDSSLTLPLGTASDEDGDLLSYSAASQNGSVTISGDSLTYTPDADWYGEDTVEVVVTDGNLSDTGFVHINVTAVNDAPVLGATINTSTLEDVAITLTSALVSGSDVEGDALTLIAFAGANYSVSDTTITPDADYSGTLAVPVALYDDTDTSNVDTIHVVVTAVNDAPVLTAVNTGLSMVQGDTLALDMDDVTATDVDNDAGDLSLVIYSGDDYSVDGSAITASSSYVGTLSVTVTVTDGQDTSNVDTLYVTVTQAASSSSSTVASSSSGEESSSSTTSSSSSSSEGSTFTVAGTNSLSAQLNIRSVSGSLDIAYTISRSGNVDIAFYNVLGVKAHELHQGPQAAGTHNILNEIVLPAGRYIAVLRLDGVTQDRSSWIMH